MKLLIILVLGLSPTAASAQSAADIAGSWTVDLRARPTDAPYSKPMVLNVAADGNVSGEFYDSVIEDGRASASNGRVCFAIRTSDGKAPYQTSGCRVGDRIVGQSWSEGRKFLLAWTATRTAP